MFQKLGARGRETARCGHDPFFMRGRPGAKTAKKPTELAILSVLSAKAGCLLLSVAIIDLTPACWGLRRRGALVEIKTWVGIGAPRCHREKIGSRHFIALCFAAAFAFLFAARFLALIVAFACLLLTQHAPPLSRGGLRSSKAKARQASGPAVAAPLCRSLVGLGGPHPLTVATSHTRRPPTHTQAADRRGKKPRGFKTDDEASIVQGSPQQHPSPQPAASQRPASCAAPPPCFSAWPPARGPSSRPRCRRCVSRCGSNDRSVIRSIDQSFGASLPSRRVCLVVGRSHHAPEHRQQTHMMALT